MRLRFRQVTFTGLFLAGSLFVGCVSHVDRTENFRFLWKIGDTERAAQEISGLADKSPRRDRILYRLEEGSVKRVNFDSPGSANAFEKAEAGINRYFGGHLKTSLNLPSEVIGLLGTPETQPYVSRVYDRVMINLYQALNYFQMDDDGRARAQIFRIRGRVQDAKDIWKRRLAELESAESSQKTVKWESIRRDPAFQHELSKLTQEFRSGYYRALPDYVNPWAIHLEALYFLATAKDRSDFEKAEFSFRELQRIFPDDPWISEDFRRAQRGMSAGNVDAFFTYVYFETGRAASRSELRIDLPVLYFDETARVPYVGVALPRLSYHQFFAPNVTITGQGFGKSPEPRLLSDMDAIITKEFKKDQPVIVTKAILNALVKAGFQYAVNKSLADKDDTTRLFGQLGTGIIAHALTKADLRSWTTLPKQVLYCRMPTPPNKKLTLRTKKGNLIKEINLASGGKINVVCVRSVSPATPLVVTSNFAF